MLATCNPNAEPEHAKSLLVELGNCVTDLRELHPHTKASIGVYPEDPAEFIHDFPGRYTADAMPVESKVALEQMQQISMITSCRKTSKKLLVATSDLDVALPSKRPSNHLAFATKPPATHEQNFMHPQKFHGPDNATVHGNHDAKHAHAGIEFEWWWS